MKLTGEVKGHEVFFYKQSQGSKWSTTDQCTDTPRLSGGRQTRICFILIPLKSQRPHKQDDLSLISWASIKIFILSAFFCWLLPMETPKVFTQTCTTTHTLYKSQLETWILPLHWGWSFLCPTCFCGHSSPVLLICCCTVAVSFTAVQFYSYSTKPQQCCGRGTEGY